MLRIIGLALLGTLLTGCGYDGHYRYPCQDPANWEKAECNPPICTTSGTCTENIIGKTLWDEYQQSKENKG